MHKLLALFLVWHVAAAIPEVETVIRQSGENFPRTWGIRNEAPVIADYEMDPEIVNDSKYRDLLPKALRSIPSVSVEMADGDLFGPERGIYSHPMESGDDWERPGRVQMVDTNGAKLFTLDCGIRIHGGWNRRPEESPKHAFRLVFKKQYGAGKLRAKIFDSAAAEEFDTLVLRAGCNNTWLHWRSLERKRGDYLRDQWMRDSQRAMGHLSPRGVFVHLYLNDLYWGIYNLVERPDESFASAYLGEARKNYDSRNSDKVLSGDDRAWTELMNRLNSGVKEEASYRRVSELVDLENFSDYMLLNLYGANADWDRSSNWYAARRREPAGKWKFFVWDAERTLEETSDSILSSDDDQSPSRIFQRLRENAQFRRLFAERARKHFVGALSAEAAGYRYRTLANEIELAIIAESARWGDYRRDVHAYREGPYELYTPELWKSEVNRLLKSYFPERTKQLIEQLRQAELYDE